MEGNATERAGMKLYKALLKSYQCSKESAQSNMNRYACIYADTAKAEDRTLYLAAKSRVEAWDEAIRLLTQDGGDWMRLDFPKS